MTFVIGKVLVIFAYLLGSVSTAIIASKVMGFPDPRSEGSENPGASNVYKIAGNKAAVITLLGDALKGLIPVLIGRYLELEEVTLVLIAMAAVLGHLYPIFFGFKGGKGVATAIGVIIGLSPLVALVSIAIWLSVYKLSNISSLSALITSLISPLLFYYIDHSVVYTVFAGILAVLITLRHRSNIEKLIDGTED